MLRSIAQGTYSRQIVERFAEICNHFVPYPKEFAKKGTGGNIAELSRIEEFSFVTFRLIVATNFCDFMKLKILEL